MCSAHALIHRTKEYGETPCQTWIAIGPDRVFTSLESTPDYEIPDPKVQSVWGSLLRLIVQEMRALPDEGRRKGRWIFFHFFPFLEILANWPLYCDLFPGEQEIYSGRP